MKKGLKTICCMLALLSACGFVACRKEEGNNAIKLTIWVSEADKAFTSQVVEEFKAKYPDKEYQIVKNIFQTTINLSRKTTCTYNTNLFICKNIDRFHNYYIIPLNLSHKTKK